MPLSFFCRLCYNKPKKQNKGEKIPMEQLAKSGSIPAVAGEGIRLYDADGKVYYDLSEISTVLG